MNRTRIMFRCKHWCDNSTHWTTDNEWLFDDVSTDKDRVSNVLTHTFIILCYTNNCMLILNHSTNATRKIKKNWTNVENVSIMMLCIMECLFPSTTIEELFTRMHPQITKAATAFNSKALKIVKGTEND